MGWFCGIIGCKENSMLTLLLGPDDFSKNEYLTQLAAERKAVVEFFNDAENLPKLVNLTVQDLFGGKKIYVLRGLLPKYEFSEELLEKLSVSSNAVVFVEEKVDKRLNATKQLLVSKHVKVQEFALPHGTELDNWILKRVKSLDASMAKSVASILAQRLGRDDAKETKFGGKVVSTEEIYNLWQADNEIKKLIAYAQGREITEADVLALTWENREVDVFNLTNAIAENEKQKALELLHKFLKEQAGSDEKAAVIQLNALLGEQFRNIAMVQDFLSRRISENNIIEQTGWKSGRLFVTKKAAARFSANKVRDCLEKLAHLDTELKTGSTPSKVLLDLILVQLFA